MIGSFARMAGAADPSAITASGCVESQLSRAGAVRVGRTCIGCYRASLATRRVGQGGPLDRARTRRSLLLSGQSGGRQLTR